MKTMNVPGLDQVSTESKNLLEQVQHKIGKVANLYATIGYSSATLKGMLKRKRCCLRIRHFLPKSVKPLTLSSG
jgi:hypothetical protein